MRLAIYCFAWEDGGAEKGKLSFQEKAGRMYALRTGRGAPDCEIYRDTAPEGDYRRRPEYERMIRDILDGRVDEVWSLGETRLNPFKAGDLDALLALCAPRRVRITLATGRLGRSDPGDTSPGRRSA